ncbi:hypothetical protein KAU39_00540 [bacterium]|nr:hypothetical protein [bacterium]
MSNEIISNLKCVKCNKEFNKRELNLINGKRYCSQCAIEFANEFVKTESDLLNERAKETSEVRSKKWKTLIICLFVICMGINAVLLPRMIKSLKGNKVIRKGAIKTDVKTDKCIKNLWQISRMIQEDSLSEMALVCPVSKKPYIVQQKDENTIVFCPNPNRHGKRGYRAIRVSRFSPIPEVLE